MNGKLAHGIDLVAISRMREILEKVGTGAHFEARVFSETERGYCRSRRDPHPHFAARFAAKEAYGKALGLGLGASGDFTEMEVVNAADGRPSLRLSGRAQELFLAAGFQEIRLSLSHDADSALASIILLG